MILSYAFRLSEAKKGNANMKKRCLSILALILASLMMVSAFAAIVTLSISAGEKTFNTTVPVYIHDLTTNALHSTFTDTRNMTI